MMEQPSLVEAASSASASDAGPQHGPEPRADTQAWDVGQATWSAADAPVVASRKGKRKRPKTASTAAAIPISKHAHAGENQKRDVRRNEQTHTSEKPHACSICPKGFANKSSIAPHERIHTGEKPYACSICPRRFSQKSHVVPHERTHTGEKPYACSMCPRRFTEKSKVVPHERTHTGEKPYACVYCGKTFAASGTARNHVRTQHQEAV